LANLRAAFEAVLRGPKVGRPEVRVYGDSLADVLEGARGLRSRAGVSVNDESALRLSAVWACIDLLAEIVSTLPVDEFRKTADGLPVAVERPTPLLKDPAADGSGFEVWCRQVMVSLLTRGNAYGFIAGLGDDGWPSQVEVLHPDQVTVRREKTFGPVNWFLDNKPIGRWPNGPLWHLPAYPVPGSPVGASPIAYARDTIGVGLAAQQFGAQWFGDGAHPTQVIKSEHEINAEQAKIIKERIIAATYDNRQPLALGDGLTMESFQVSPDESQFLETIRANVADVARFFRVPPEMIGGESGSSMTYSTLESRALHLLTFAVGPWLTRIERSLSRLRPGPRFVKFNADALIRVDLLSRYKAHDLALRGGWKSRDDVRRIEDLPPIPDGDEYLWPPYSVTLEAPEAPAPEGEPNVDGPPQPA
jgi:HK97 family phage portal protein